MTTGHSIHMDDFKKVYLIGIGGIGMSGLAEILRCYGYTVMGSDLKESKVTRRLRKMGVDIKIGQKEENILSNNIDIVVYSSGISNNNPELKAAVRRNIPMLRRMEALVRLVSGKKVIAISGAHGKTTTTSLTALLLIRGGLDPTVFIGGDVDFLDGNARYGQGEFVVTEADESDGSFLLLNPMYSITTNVDMEHMDYYKTMENVRDAYRKFIENTEDSGCAFICAEDENLMSIKSGCKKNIFTYGISEKADIKAKDIRLMGLNGSEFDVILKDKRLGKIRLSLVGIHNVINSLASIGIAIRLGVEFSLIKDVISTFRGVERRLKITTLSSDILIIDDYAHHPTEIATTLKAMETIGRRKIVIFQPHRYTRTQYLREEFGKCFGLADHLVITDIYSAGEKHIEGVSGRDIYESAVKWGHKDVCFIHKDFLIDHIIDIIRPGDAVFFMGAGDIGELPEKIIELLKDTKIDEVKI